MIKDTTEQLISDRISLLRQDTDFVATIFESLVGYGIIAADFDGNIIAYNKGAYQIFGYEPEDMVGRQSIDLLFPADFVKSGKLSQITAALIKEGRISFEGKMLRKNGQDFSAQTLFTVTKNKRGKIAGFVEIVEDLTERKQAERALADKQTMALRIKELEKELNTLKKLSNLSQTPVSAQMFGAKPLNQSPTQIFKKLTSQYEEIMDMALEQRAYKVQHNISGSLNSIALELALLNAGPRDVIDIHSTVMARKGKNATPHKVAAYLEEGRLTVLELMGYLVSYYRNLARGSLGIKEHISKQKTI